MTLEAGLIALCAIVSIGSMLLVGVALWLRASESGERFSIRKILLARLRGWTHENAKGVATGIIAGLLFLAALPTSLVLAAGISTAVAAVILAFWTGAIGVKWGTKNE